jgi:gas vesicle protein
MNTFLIMIGIIVILGIAIIILQKTGKIEDEDEDLIPDVIEDSIEEVKAKTAKAKSKFQELKKEIDDVVREGKEAIDEIQDVVEEVKDVVDVIVPPKKKRGRPRKNK